MKKLGPTLVGAAGLGIALISSQAQAAPSCTAGTTTITTTTTILDSSLGAGTCVQAGDKLFGTFSYGNLPINANSGTTFSLPATTIGTYTVAFGGFMLGPSMTAAGFGFEAQALTPTVALINDVEGDLTFQPVNASLAASVTITGTTAPASTPISCTRTASPTTSSCPSTDTFSPLSDIVLTQTATTGPNALIAAVFDSVSETAVAIPEPASLALLGSALVGLGLARRRRKAA